VPYRLAVAALLIAISLNARGQRNLAPPPSPTTDSALEQRVREVASMLRCPVCLNLSIQDSPSELARDMRGVVREHLARGETREQVLQYFIQRYGDWVLMQPPVRGVSLLVWLLPAVAIVGGGTLVVFAVKRWVRNSAASAAAVPEDELRKVREELAKSQLD